MSVNYIVATRLKHLRYLLDTYAQYSQNTSLEGLEISRHSFVVRVHSGSECQASPVVWLMNRCIQWISGEW
jgi:hypothetical protein